MLRKAKSAAKGDPKKSENRIEVEMEFEQKEAGP